MLSKIVLRIESPTPIPKPRIKPSNKLSAVFGDEGAFGNDALLTIETLMAEELAVPEISRLLAVMANC